MPRKSSNSRKSRGTFGNRVRDDIVDLTADVIVNRVIACLSCDDQRQHREAMSLLLNHGPTQPGRPGLEFHQSETGELSSTPSKHTKALISATQRELLQFVRDVVVTEPFGRIRGRLNINALTFGAANHDSQGVGTILFATDGKWTDVVKLHFIMLVHLAGLKNLSRCRAEDCERVFVRKWGREYCSTRCEERLRKRKQRVKEKEQEARDLDALRKGR